MEFRAAAEDKKGGYRIAGHSRRDRRQNCQVRSRVLRTARPKASFLRPIRSESPRSTPPVGDVVRKRVWVVTIVAIVPLLVGWHVVVVNHVRLYYGTFYPYAAEIPLRLSASRVHVFASSRLAFRYHRNKCVYLSWDARPTGSSSGSPSRRDRSGRISQSATDENEVKGGESSTVDRQGSGKHHQDAS
jgi:hypothetical protein